MVMTISMFGNNMLRCSILGVTGQHIMELTGKAAYEAEIAYLRERCLLLNRDSSGSPEDFTNRDGRIKYEPEFRFMLTRHWTLFNSMLHSKFMATRLGVWRDKGRRMLETFIVKMGVPLAQCKVDYSSMEMDLKESLPSRINKHAAEFGIEDVSIPSFLREFGFVMRLSASDAVYALMALIEAPYSAIEYCNLSGNGPVEDTLAIWVKNFYYAFDALDS
jgi:cell division control protein 45